MESDPIDLVIGNVDAQGNIVSYTIADKNGTPQFIMQPLEFQVYQSATPGIRAMMDTSPQWALDYASALIYNSTGQTSAAADHAGLVLTNPSMWVENAVGLLGGVLAGAEIQAVNSRIGTIINVRAISAEEANAPFVAKGWSPPYDTGSQVRTFTTTSEVKFMRVSTIDNPQGAFLVRADEIAGMTPQQIQQYLALPKVPTQIADVTVPAGTKMQVGQVAAQATFGAVGKGGTQYQLLNPIPNSSFGTPRPIK